MNKTVKNTIKLYKIESSISKAWIAKKMKEAYVGSLYIGGYDINRMKLICKKRIKELSVKKTNHWKVALKSYETFLDELNKNH